MHSDSERGSVLRYAPPLSFCITVLFCVPLLTNTACQNRTTPDPFATKDMQLETEDGFTLTATLYPANAPSPPGLILVHMLGQDRTSWRSFALQAQRKGYMCVTFDLAGHGQSRMRNGETVSHSSFSEKQWLSRTSDLSAARAALIEAGADAENVATLGASIGANLALLHALENDDVQSLVLLSPGLNYRGVRIENSLRRSNTVPVLLIASEGDSYAASSCATLEAVAAGFCEARYYPGSFHGTDLLDASESATAQIFQWLDSTLDSTLPRH